MNENNVGNVRLEYLVTNTAPIRFRREGRRAAVRRVWHEQL